MALSQRHAILALFAVVISLMSVTSHANNYVFSYYYGMETGLKPWEQPASKITHLIFSFANIIKDGTVTLLGPTNSPAGLDAFKKATQKTYKNWDSSPCNCQGQCLKGELWQLYLFKKKYPHIKTIMSIGGWTWSDNFSDVFSNADARRRAIETSARLMEELGFDGLDVDWEFPGTAKSTAEFPFWSNRPQDWDNLAKFFEEARATWKDKYMLTVAATAFVYPGSERAVRSLAKSLDALLVMSYEFQHGRSITWGTGTMMVLNSDPNDVKTHNVVAGINTYIQNGVPKNKIVMGIPLYASGYTGVDPNSKFLGGIPGLGAPTAKAQMVQPIAYNVLLTTIVNKPNWKKTVDTARGVTVYYDASSGSVWYVDNPDTVKMKAKYVKDQGYAGIMLWNSNQDMPENDQASLMSAIAIEYPANTTPLRKESFCLPESSTPWCNLKCGYKFPEGNFDELSLDSSTNRKGSNGSTGTSAGSDSSSNGSNSQSGRSQTSSGFAVSGISVSHITVIIATAVMAFMTMM